MRRRKCHDGKPCSPECPIPAVDNGGKPYGGCPRWTIKPLAEIEAMAEADAAEREARAKAERK